MVKEWIRYYIGDQLILKASSFKYLGISICSDLNWADYVKYTLRKAWKALHFIIRILKMGNNNTKRLAYTAIWRPILEYRAVCFGPIQSKALHIDISLATTCSCICIIRESVVFIVADVNMEFKYHSADCPSMKHI